MARRARRKASSEDVLRLDLPLAAAVLEIVCVHMAGPRPFCVEERLISLETVPEAADADFSETTPGQWLLSQVPWSTAEHRIQAIPAGKATASGLDVPEGTACLVIERRTWSGSGPVTHVRFTYPGDRHALVARFTPAS
jgi:GntR family histidine utilization transcriptional repressor